MLMKGRRTSSRRIRPEEILAICIRLTAPSCMRAPPEAETISKGWKFAMERSIARMIISPTTEPMLPPIKRGSMAQICTARPPRRPDAAIIASARSRDNQQGLEVCDGALNRAHDHFPHYGAHADC